MATVCSTAKKQAAHEQQKRLRSLRATGDQFCRLPGLTRNNYICTSTATELRKLVISYRYSSSYRTKYGTYFNRLRALNFCYTNYIVLQKSFHIHSINNSSFVEDQSGLHRLHHLLSGWKHSQHSAGSEVTCQSQMGPGKISFL